MARQTTKSIKSIPPHLAHIKPIESFVLPDDYARSRDFSGLYAGMGGGKPTPDYSSLSRPTIERVKAASRGGRTAISNPSKGSFQFNKRSGPGADPGDRMARLGKAIDYSKYAHDAFAALAEYGGKAGRRAFAPLGYALDAIGAGATYTASRQRGEPVDVAVVRAAAPVSGSALGGVGGAAAGAAIFGVGGSAIPVLGTAAGITTGGIAGGAAGSYKGKGVGEDVADAYARVRRYREW